MSADGTLTAIESLQHSSAGAVAIRGDRGDAGGRSNADNHVARDGMCSHSVSMAASDRGPESSKVAEGQARRNASLDSDSRPYTTSQPQADGEEMAAPLSLSAAAAAAAAPHTQPAAAADEAQSPTEAAKAEALTILLGAGMAEEEALAALDATARDLSTAAGPSAGNAGLTEETLDLDDDSTAFECAPLPAAPFPVFHSYST